MNLTISVLSADDLSNLSRLDPLLLSQQTQMEMFVDDFAEKSDFQDESGNYTDYTTWKGVTCDDNQHVSRISMSGDFLRKSPKARIQWELIPIYVKQLKISFFDLDQSIEMQSLPSSIVDIEVPFCNLSGSIDTKDFSPLLENVHMQKNKLEGSLALENLPNGNLKSLCLWGNAFVGSVNLLNLPEQLQTLILSENKLSGGIDLSRLPMNFQRFQATDNYLEGAIDMRKVSVTLNIIELSRNKFKGDFKIHENREQNRFQALTIYIDSNFMNGSIFFERLHNETYELNLSTNLFHGTLNFSKMPTHLQFLDISSNRFSGDVEFDSLPEHIIAFHIQKNLFDGFFDLYALCESPLLSTIDVSHNHFTDSSEIDKLPPSVEDVNLSFNEAFYGTITLRGYDDTHLKMLDTRGTSIEVWVNGGETRIRSN